MRAKRNWFSFSVICIKSWACLVSFGSKSKPTSPRHPCPTTFSCGVVFGFKVMRFTLSRLLSSAMFA